MQNRDDHVDELCKLLRLTPEAISVAEGWSILPPRIQKHIQLVINDYIASQVPMLDALYSRASMQDQIRFNRIIEEAQDRTRRGPPDSDSAAEG